MAAPPAELGQYLPDHHEWCFFKKSYATGLSTCRGRKLRRQVHSLVGGAGHPWPHAAAGATAGAQIGRQRLCPAHGCTGRRGKGQRREGGTASNRARRIQVSLAPQTGLKTDGINPVRPVPFFTFDSRVSVFTRKYRNGRNCFPPVFAYFVFRWDEPYLSRFHLIRDKICNIYIT